VISVFVVFRKLFQSLRTGFADPTFRGTVQLALVLLLAGTLFYARVEHWTLFHSLYFSVTTLTTVGYGDFMPQTEIGRAFTIVYVIIGLGVVLSVVTQIAGHATKSTTQTE
jgi:hypothetical protein